MTILLVFGVLAALQDAAEPNQLIVPLRMAQRADVQVFFDRGKGIRAEDCVTRAVPGGVGAAEVAFSLPREPIRELRFDPMMGAGEFAVGAPRLENRAGTVLALFPITAVVPRHQIADFHREGDWWIGTTVAGANDPQLTFELGAPLGSGHVRPPWLETIGLALTAALTIGLGLHPANRGWRSRLPADLGRRFCDWLSTPGRSAVIVGLLLVATVECRRLWPLHHTLDWPVWDEVNYAGAGAAWMRSGGTLGALHESPLYVLSYGLLTSVSGVATAIMAQHYLLKLGSVLLLYGLLTRWTRSWLGAAGLALWWGASQFQIEFPLLVYHGAWVWFLAALLCLDKWPLTGVALMAAATAVRQEYQFALLAAIGWAAWILWRQRTSRWRLVASGGPRWIGIVTLSSSLAVVALVTAETGFRGTGGRAWFAFQQHYAVRAQAEGEAPAINPWLEYADVVRRDFGPARSLGEAWKINPSALLRHVIYNVTHIGPELAALAQRHGRIGAGTGWLIAGAVLILAAGRSDANGTPASLGMAASGVLVVAPSLLVLAKGAYLLPLVPFLLGSGCWLIGRLKVPERAGVWLIGAGAGVSVAMLTMEGIGPAVFVPGERPRPVAETVQALQAIWPAQGKHALLGVAASSYGHYLGSDRCDGREAIGAASGRAGARFSLAAAVADPQLHAVLVTNDWRGLASFEQREFDATLAAPAWRRRDVAAGTLYWRATPSPLPPRPPTM